MSKDYLYAIVCTAPGGDELRAIITVHRDHKEAEELLEHPSYRKFHSIEKDKEGFDYHDSMCGERQFVIVQELRVSPSVSEEIERIIEMNRYYMRPVAAPAAKETGR